MIHKKKPCIYLTYTVWWVWSRAQKCLGNHHHIHHSKSFLVSFFFYRNTWDSSLNKMSVHNTVVISIGKILYNTSSEHIHLVLLKFYTNWTTIPYLPHPSGPSHHHSILCFCESDCFTFLTYMVTGSVCPSVTGLFHLAYCPLGSSLLSKRARFPFSKRLNDISLCVYT